MRVKGVIMSLALRYSMRDTHHCSEMTYTVSCGTFNSTIPYRSLEFIGSTVLASVSLKVCGF